LKIVKRDERATFLDYSLVWAYANPIDLFRDSVLLGSRPDTTDTNNSVKGSLSDRSHAIAYTKATSLVRITLVRPFIYEYSHDAAPWYYLLLNVYEIPPWPTDSPAAECRCPHIRIFSRVACAKPPSWADSSSWRE
jgi:hypothetical protein